MYSLRLIVRHQSGTRHILGDVQLCESYFLETIEDVQKSYVTAEIENWANSNLALHLEFLRKMYGEIAWNMSIRLE